MLSYDEDLYKSDKMHKLELFVIAIPNRNRSVIVKL